jgi:hypothetical protein
MAIDPKVFEQLKEQNPRAVSLTAGGDTVVVNPPSRAHWRRFKTAARDEKKRGDALEIILRDCLLHPEPHAFEAMIEKRPGLVEVFAEEVLELAGAGLEVEKNA